MPHPNQPILMEALPTAAAEMKWVDDFSRVLDSRYRIPGTKIRFGADFLLGLFPGVGDFVSLAMSVLLIATMAKHGASAKLVLRMLSNVVFDAVVGSVPFFGSVFDLFYKANLRNARLMREYYAAGKPAGRVWPLVLGVLAFLVLVMIVTLVLLSMALRWVLQQVG